jgi:hypothetical protein
MHPEFDPSYVLRLHARTLSLSNGARLSSDTSAHMALHRRKPGRCGSAGLPRVGHTGGQGPTRASKVYLILIVWPM